MEPPAQFILPLFREASRTDDQAPLQIATSNQLFDQQSGHDRLSGTRIVREKKPQRLTRQHRFVDGCDLMRQRINKRGMHGKHRIKEMSKADSMGFGNKPEHSPIPVEAPRSADLNDFNPRLVMAVKELIG